MAILLPHMSLRLGGAIKQIISASTREFCTFTYKQQRLRRACIYAKSLQSHCSSYTQCRAVEIPCPTCPTWSHFIQDKLKISMYLSLDKYKLKMLINYYEFTGCIENIVYPDQLAS